MLMFSKGSEPIFVLLPLLVSPSCWSQLDGRNWCYSRCHGWAGIQLRPGDSLCVTLWEKGWKNEGKLVSSRSDLPADSSVEQSWELSCAGLPVSFQLKPSESFWKHSWQGQHSYAHTLGVTHPTKQTHFQV